MTENRAALASKAEAARVMHAIIVSSSKELELTDSGIEKLIAKFNAQLDRFWALEPSLPVPAEVIDPAALGATPLKSHIKKNVQRVEELKKSWKRFLAQGGVVALAQELLSEPIEQLVCGNDTQYLSDEKE